MDDRNGGKGADVDHTPSTSEQPSRPHRHRLLANKCRRLALEVLADRAEPIDLHALAGTVASRERRTDDVEDGMERRIRISHHHVHVPKLDDAGLCSYDEQHRRVDADQTAATQLLEAE